MASNISHYESEEEIAKKTVVVKKRMQKRDRQWTMEKIYSSAKEALEFIDLKKHGVFIIKIRLRMATKVIIDAIKLNLETLSVHQVYIYYSTVAAKMCFCLEP